MTLDDVEELTQTLTELQGVSAKLNDRELNFVTDMKARLDKYGDRTFVSPKQSQWLNNIYQKYLG